MPSSIFLSLPIALLLATLTACSDDSSPDEGAGACNPLRPAGPFISETVVGTKPVPQGGSLSAGTYVLTAMAGDKGDAVPRRDLLSITTPDKSSLQIDWSTEQQGGEITIRSGSVAITSATELTFLWACPTLQNEAASGYTSDGTTLTVFGALGTLTFQRQ